MKTLLLITIVFGLNTANADCSSSGLYFFPQQKEISLNSMFLISGYYNSQKTIEKFKDRKIYLTSDNGEKIELILQNIYVGQMHLTQAFFKPINKLSPNTIYFLQYENQTDAEKEDFEQWNSTKKLREKVNWITTDSKNTQPLNLDLGIEYNKSEVTPFGCGPAAYAIFTLKNRKPGEVWSKTEVVNISTGKQTTYILPVANETLSVGHGMCSGAFSYEPTGQYKVRFTLMNIDGKALVPTNWITFDSPFMKK